MICAHTRASSFVSAFCSPSQEEHELARSEYSQLRQILSGEIFQSGSYARFTSTTPLNDLDVFWVIPEETKRLLFEGEIRMPGVLDDLAAELRKGYAKFGRDVRISAQTHSVMIEFNDVVGLDFTVDVVPARKLGEVNEFGSNLYSVPEVGLLSKRQRQAFYESRMNKGRDIWIKTDPKGYIAMASRTNEKSSAFRKATKLVKRWKASWKDKNNFGSTEYKLKSFHIEQAIQKIVEANPAISILEVCGRFWAGMESYLDKPRFPDRAQEEGGEVRYIDEYVTGLSQEEKRMIMVSAKSACILLGRLEEANLENWLHRLVAGEEFIEGYGFSYDSATVQRNSRGFEVDGRIRPKAGGFQSGWLRSLRSRNRALGVERKIDFQVTKPLAGTNAEQFWKVRNLGADAMKENSLRGEISKGTTNNSPERTAYRGEHEVSCYLVENNRVIAESKVTVPIRRP